MDDEQKSSIEASVGHQRAILGRGVLIALPIALAIWAGVFLFVPPLPGDTDLLARMVVAIKCSCVAVLLCLVTGIEAAAHERFVSPAIDPLTGHESRQMKINLRYLQNTLEQSLIFIAGLMGLAAYCSDAGATRAVVAATIV
ncbi:MAG: hypothetical protein ACR2GP_00995 [Burkholderiaceae bacterium]